MLTAIAVNDGGAESASIPVMFLVDQPHLFALLKR